MNKQNEQMNGRKMEGSGARANEQTANKWTNKMKWKVKKKAKPSEWKNRENQMAKDHDKQAGREV